MTASKTAIPLQLSPVLPDGELLESALLPGSAEAAAAVAEIDAQARGASKQKPDPPGATEHAHAD